MMTKLTGGIASVGVLAAMYWYVTSQQHVVDDKIDVEFAKFDENFARAWSEGPKADWKEAGKEAHERRIKAEERLEKDQAVDDAAFDDLTQELDAEK